MNETAEDMKQARGNTAARLLDRIIGVPALAAAGLFRARRAVPDILDSLAVVSLGCIGDTLLLDGPLRDFLTIYPGCRVTLFVARANAETASLLDTVHEVVTLPLGDPVGAWKKLRAASFDACIDAGQWARISGLYALAVPARYRVGFRTPGQHRHLAFDAAADHLPTRHELDNFRALFAPLGVRGNSIPTLDPPIGASLPGQPYVVFHPMPSGRKAHLKEWPGEMWDTLARLCVEMGIDVLYSGSPDDAPRIEERVAAVRNPLVRSLAGKTGLGELSSILRHARVVVSVNTGIMHLAAAAGARLVSLNGPTSVDRWGPVAEPSRSVALTPDLPCAPCLNLGFEYGCDRGDCMRALSVEQVFWAMQSLMR